MLDDIAAFLNVSVGLNTATVTPDCGDGGVCQARAFRYLTHGNIAYEVTLGDEFRPSATRTARQRLIIVFRP